MSLPTEPYSRIERYLAKLAGQEVDIPDKPITRIECYLDYIVNNGGGVPAADAGARNGIFQGKPLGTSFTAAQKTAISEGTFEGLSVGDYWEMDWNGSPFHFRIAGFDLLLRAGDPSPMSRHHAVIVPDEGLGACEYSVSEFTGDYPNSTLKTYITTDIIPGLEELFGTLLSYNLRVTTGATTTAWIVSKADALSSISTIGEYASTGYFTSISNSLFLPFPLFNLAPWFITSPGYTYWLQEVASNTRGITITSDGRKGSAALTASNAVRPFFCIGDAS